MAKPDPYRIRGTVLFAALEAAGFNGCAVVDSDRNVIEYLYHRKGQLYAVIPLKGGWVNLRKGETLLTRVEAEALVEAPLPHRNPKLPAA